MKYNKIALIGMMGSGKTTISKLLSKKLNINFFDSDEIFVEEFGEIKKYFAEFGEASFREKESAILKEISEKDNFVLSCGGGIIVTEANRDILFKGDIFTIFLNTSPDEIFKRLQNNYSRPLLETEDKLKSINSILSSREKYYTMADLDIITDDKQPENIVDEIINFMKDLKKWKKI